MLSITEELTPTSLAQFYGRLKTIKKHLPPVGNDRTQWLAVNPPINFLKVYEVEYTTKFANG